MAITLSEDSVSFHSIHGPDAVKEGAIRVRYIDTVRPHQALGYPSGLSPSGRSLSEAKGRSLTPEEFYQHRLHNQLGRKEALSDIS